MLTVGAVTHVVEGRQWELGWVRRRVWSTFKNKLALIMANNKGIIASNDLTFWFITGLTLNAIGLTPGLRGLHLLLFALDLFQLTQVMFALTLLFQGCAKKSILTFALWFWNQTWTILTLSPVSLANVSLTFNSNKKKLAKWDNQVYKIWDNPYFTTWLLTYFKRRFERSPLSSC